MHAGLAGLARTIYAAYSLLCHQLPERSWFLFGRAWTPGLETIRQAAGRDGFFALRRFVGTPTVTNDYLYAVMPNGSNFIATNLGALLVFTTYLFVSIYALVKLIGNAPEHGDLSNVSQRIRYRPLEQAIRRTSQSRGGSEVIIESSDPAEETLYPIRPLANRGISPQLRTSCHGKCPVHQIADMPDDCTRGSACISDLQGTEPLGSIPQDLGCTICQGG